MAGAFDEKFDLMLETEYGDDEIGELEPGQEGQVCRRGRGRRGVGRGGWHS